MLIILNGKGFKRKFKFCADCGRYTWWTYSKEDGWYCMNHD